MKSKIETIYIIVASLFFINILQAEENLIKNPGIEDGQDGWSSYDCKGAQSVFSIDEGVFHSGKKSLKIVQTNNYPAYSFWSSANIQVDLEEAATFKLTLFIKAEDSGWITVVLRGDDQKYYNTVFSIAGSGYFDWKEYKAEVKVPAGIKNLRVDLMQRSEGAVWFDDISMSENFKVAAGGVDPGTVKAMPAATKAPPRSSGPDLIQNVMDADNKHEPAPNSIASIRYIYNSDMSEKSEGDDMPAGWKVEQTAEGEETAGKTEWIKDVPLNGQYALKLTWIAGPQRCAISPTLSDKVKGNKALTLRSYVKTEKDGKAFYVIDKLNKDGKVIQRESSPAVSSPGDWGTLQYDFITESNTEDIRIFCVNGGKGSVLFHLVDLYPNFAEISRTAKFPVNVSCEPAEGNRSWNNGKRVFNSISRSPNSMSFCFWGDKNKASVNTSLIIECPRSIIIPEAFYLDYHIPNNKQVEFTKENIAGKMENYTRYIFGISEIIKRLGATPYSFGAITLCFVPENDSPGNEYKIYYRLKDKNMETEAQEVALNILPPMSKTPNPKKFGMTIWNGEDIDYYNSNLVEKVAAKYEEAGLDSRKLSSLKSDAAKVDDILRTRGWRFMRDIHHDFLHLAKSQAIDGRNGKPVSHFPCPTDFITSPQVFSNMVGWLKKDSIVKLKDNEPVIYDFEPFGFGSKYCYCADCIAGFSRDYAIPLSEIKNRRDILVKYSKEWTDYWIKTIHKVIIVFTRAVKEVKPNNPVCIYDYPLYYNKNGVEDFFANCPLDPRVIEQTLDGHYSSFYHHLGKKAFDLLDVNVKNLKKPLWVMPMVGGSLPFWDHTENPSPDDLRQTIVAAASTGAKGVSPYTGLFLDGLYFISMDKAMNEIANLESYYIDGIRDDGTISWEGVARDGAIKSDWDEYVGARVHKLDNKLLVTLFNFNSTENAVIKIKRNNVSFNKFALYDPIQQKTEDELDNSKDGCIIEIPPKDVKFLLSI